MPSCPVSFGYREDTSPDADEVISRTLSKHHQRHQTQPLEPSLHSLGSVHSNSSSPTNVPEPSPNPERADPPELIPAVSREANAPPPAEQVTVLRFWAHYAVLALAAMLGTLIRLGLEALATYDGRAVYPTLWAQGVGCGVMGLALARKNQITWIYPPLHTFFTTGIAGSITTFSSWMLESYEAFSNFDQYNRKGLHDTVDGLAYSFSTFAVSMACLILGEHMAHILPHLPRLAFSRRQDDTFSNHNKSGNITRDPELGTANPLSENTPPSSVTCHSSPKSNEKQREREQRRLGVTPWLDVIALCSAALVYLIALLIYFFAPRYWRHDVVFALLLSPPGAAIRFAFSRINTRPRFLDRFPLGTFTVNMLGTIVIAASFAGQRRPASYSNVTMCDALYALQQGFCGCLTTVSTFVVEMRAIKGWKAKWIYLFSSVILGHLFVLALVGGQKWGESLGPQCSGTA